MTNSHDVKVTKSVAWSVFLIGVAFGVLGNFFDWYRQIQIYDEVNHAFSSFGLALLIGAYAESSVFANVRAHQVWQGALVAGAAVAGGAIWELAEWLYDRVVTGDVIKNKTDTIIDLACDSVGALLGAVLIVALARGWKASVPHSA